MAGLLNTLKKNWRGLLDEVQAAPESLRALTQPAAAQQFDAALRKGGTIDKEKAVQMAMDVLQTTPMGVMGKIVYHGSPHKFDKFDMSKIGTGEGAQAYGHGLYFSDAQDVANGYRVNLSYDPDKMKIAGQQINKYYDMISQKAAKLPAKMASGEYEKLDLLERFMMNDSYEQVAKYATESGYSPATSKWLRDTVKPTFETYGSLYKVDIPDEAVSRMLDWDKPLSQQAQEVRAALKNAPTMRLRDGMAIPGGGKLKVVQDEDFGTKYFIDYGDQKLKITEPEVRNLLGGGTEGKSLFSELINTYGPKKAEDWLRAKGIPGIRYLDGGSRTAGEGTSNFVLFDDQLPRILERNGIPTGLNPWAPGEWRGLLEP